MTGTSTQDAPPDTTVARPLFSPFAVVASCVGFALIGALQALYGPAIPAFRTEFGLSPAAAGLSLSAHFVGGVAGVLLLNRVHGRLGNRTLLSASYALMALGGTGFALAPVWEWALACALVTGVGFGGIDYGLNQLFSVGFGRRSPAMLNIIGAAYGLGAVGGPALLGLLGPGRYPAVFAGFAVLSAVLVLAQRGVREGGETPAEPAEEVEEAEETDGRAPGVRASAALVVTVFIVLYVLMVAVETGVGGWEPTHLESVGHDAATVATATSAFWLMVTVGRLLVAPLTLRWSVQTIMVVSSVGMVACLLLALIPAAAPYAYAGVGLFHAPIFPTGLPWLSRAVPRARRAGAHVIAASMIGGVAAGPVLGKGIELAGVDAVPVLLALPAAGCLAATWWLIRATRVRP
ncbi:MFS transporter [Streptomyces sp. Go-475]|uniref:MFS transporter n=1 Tax=Streptomyces sp. Go-475 TaxID=2072505 RepID=UPI000DF0C55B|nr:MFS transporter [Streptomyces sp. Go-475]AXE89330.1 Major Facilitator Superfamily protein [Streptomyces sp. Go-475]